jgi:pyruvate ferredoxin oxidoreductase beta subunit
LNAHGQRDLSEKDLSHPFCRQRRDFAVKIPEEEYLLKCTAACAGCSDSLTLRYVLKAAGPDTVLVVPACCTSVIQGAYPYTAFNLTVVNIAFAAAAACASGMSEALRALGRKNPCHRLRRGRRDPRHRHPVPVRAFERGTDFLYICYDNEAYGNTGMQRSGGTPLGARTTTTPMGKRHQKKDIDAIVAAHDPPFMATACPAYPRDLFQKVRNALTFRGPSFIHVLAPCPPGWRFPPEKSVEMGKLAVKTGMWVLYERRHGKLSLSAPSKTALKNPAPLEEYLSPQGRFEGMDGADIEALKRHISENLLKLASEEAKG